MHLPNRQMLCLAVDRPTAAFASAPQLPRTCSQCRCTHSCSERGGPAFLSARGVPAVRRPHLVSRPAVPRRQRGPLRSVAAASEAFVQTCRGGTGGVFGGGRGDGSGGRGGGGSGGGGRGRHLEPPAATSAAVAESASSEDVIMLDVTGDLGPSIQAFLDFSWTSQGHTCSRVDTRQVMCSAVLLQQDACKCCEIAEAVVRQSQLCSTDIL